jgi:hypothetical protein
MESPMKTFIRALWLGTSVLAATLLHAQDPN